MVQGDQFGYLHAYGDRFHLHRVLKVEEDGDQLQLQLRHGILRLSVPWTDQQYDILSSWEEARKALKVRDGLARMFPQEEDSE